MLVTTLFIGSQSFYGFTFNRTEIEKTFHIHVIMRKGSPTVEVERATWSFSCFSMNSFSFFKSSTYASTMIDLWEVQLQKGMNKQ